MIHTKNNGEITETDLDKARKAVREVDEEKSPINAIVSVLMLREGWDVQNVTVVVGLRPYTSKANIRCHAITTSSASLLNSWTMQRT